MDSQLILVLVLTGGMLLLLFGLVGWVFYSSYRLRERDTAEFMAWLQNSGCTVGGLQQPRAPYFYQPNTTAWSLGNYFKGETNLASGVYKGLTIETFTNKFSVPRGKTHDEWRVHALRVVGDFSFPRTYLDRKKNNSINGAAYYPSPIYNPSILSLEGNFYQYFDVVCQSGQEQEVTQLLAPNVMEKLTKLDFRIDLELSGGNLYIYFVECNKFTTFDDVIGLLLDAATEIAPVFDKVAKLNPISFGEDVVQPVSKAPRFKLTWRPFVLSSVLVTLFLFAEWELRGYGNLVVVVAIVILVLFRVYKRRDLK